MTVNRDIIVEQGLIDRIDALNQGSLFLSSMPSDFMEKTTAEFDKTATVTQYVYEASLGDVVNHVDFFENQASVVNALHSVFLSLPEEVQVNYNTFIGSKKLAAFNVICKRLDPDYAPPCHHLLLDDFPSLNSILNSISNEILTYGSHSSIMFEFLNHLSGVPGF